MVLSFSTYLVPFLHCTFYLKGKLWPFLCIVVWSLVIKEDLALTWYLADRQLLYLLYFPATFELWCSCCVVFRKPYCKSESITFKASLRSRENTMKWPEQVHQQQLGWTERDFVTACQLCLLNLLLLCHHSCRRNLVSGLKYRLRFSVLV